MGARTVGGYFKSECKIDKVITIQAPFLLKYMYE